MANPAAVRSRGRIGAGARQIKDCGQSQHKYPAGDRPRHPRERVHHEVDDDAPDRRTHDEALRQRNTVVGLAQRGADNDVANAGERD